MSQPLRVLFVCTANISRSPFLEITARTLAGDATDVVFASAGTHGFDARGMDEGMVPLLPEGVDSEHASRRLTRAVLADADLVLTAEASHRTFILEEFPEYFRKVFTVGQFAGTVAEHPGLRGRDLVAAASARRSPTRPEDDIADPYRRGEAASATAAATMSRMLDVIVPRLTAGARDV